MIKELKEIKERLEKAPKGPWSIDYGVSMRSAWSINQWKGGPILWLDGSQNVDLDVKINTVEETLELIENAPTDIARLIKAIEWALSKKNEWVRQAHTDQSPMDIEATIEAENEELSKILKGET